MCFVFVFFITCFHHKKKSLLIRIANKHVQYTLRCVSFSFFVALPENCRWSTKKNESKEYKDLTNSCRQLFTTEQVLSLSFCPKRFNGRRKRTKAISFLFLQNNNNSKVYDKFDIIKFFFWHWNKSQCTVWYLSHYLLFITEQRKTSPTFFS